MGFLSGLAACALLSSPAPPVDLGLALEHMVDHVELAYSANRPVKPVFTDMRSLVEQWGDQDAVTRERLLRAIADLEARCARAKMALADTMRLQAQVTDARLDLELRRLWTAARERGATRAELERVADLLRHRAEVAKQPPDISRRVDAAFQELKVKAGKAGALTATELSAFEDVDVMARLDRALVWLEELAVERRATREQFLRVSDLMDDRARIWQKDTELQNHVAQVKQQVDRLMDRIMQSGTVDRAEFERLRETCMTRARAAAFDPGN